MEKKFISLSYTKHNRQYEIVESVDGQYMVLVNGFQWGINGQYDASGACNQTWNSWQQAIAAIQEFA